MKCKFCPNEAETIRKSLDGESDYDVCSECARVIDKYLEAYQERKDVIRC